MVICLERPSPAVSSGLPAARPSLTLGTLWCGSHLAAYLALLRLGVTVPPSVAGGAVGSYPTFSPLPSACARGGLFSVALSVALRRPGVTWQSTRWSSDFPRDARRRPATTALDPPRKDNSPVRLGPTAPRGRGRAHPARPRLSGH